MDAIVRQQLVLLYRILEKVEGESYQHIYEALENGYSLDYPTENTSGVVEREHSAEECKEVWDILSMYDAIHFRLRDLADKEGIDPDTFTFGGFDGNHDWQYGYQVYIVETLERYREILPEPINSHGTVLPMYRHQLQLWKELMRRRENMTNRITKDDLLELQAQWWPRG